MPSFFFFQAEDGIRDSSVTGVQTCALPISSFGASWLLLELLTLALVGVRLWQRAATVVWHENYAELHAPPIPLPPIPPAPPTMELLEVVASPEVPPFQDAGGIHLSEK